MFTKLLRFVFFLSAMLNEIIKPLIWKNRFFFFLKWIHSAYTPSSLFYVEEHRARKQFVSSAAHCCLFTSMFSIMLFCFFFINSSVLGVVGFVGSWHHVPSKDLVLLWNHFYWLGVGSFPHSYWLYGWALPSESLPKVFTTWNPWLWLAKWPFIMKTTSIQP